MSFTLLHEPYHGVHHRHAGLPHAKLPQFVAVLVPARPDELPPFASYWHAFLDLFRSLADPRVGAQWGIGKPVRTNIGEGSLRSSLALSAFNLGLRP